MDAELAALPDDVDALKAALLAARADVARVTAEAAAALAEQSANLALIAHLRLQIQKLNRDRFGPRSERTARLLDQMELQLEELEASATEAIEAHLDGPDIAIAFNPTYLVDGLNALDATYARLAFTTSTKPAVITGGSADGAAVPGADYRHLLMPVRLSG